MVARGARMRAAPGPGGDVPNGASSRTGRNPTVPSPSTDRPARPPRAGRGSPEGGSTIVTELDLYDAASAAP